MNEKLIIAVVIILSVAVLGFWIFNETKPKPGTLLPDEGRTHVEIGTNVQYGTNPPTSGNHYAQWTKWGVYDAPKDDRNTTHSLEHGYIIMHYNCDVKQSGFILVPSVLAQMDNSPMTVASDSAEQMASAAASLSENFKSDDCKELIKNLTEVYNAKGQIRLMVLPRPNMDSRIAVTSWRYMEKMNNFDRNKIESFISGHINQGPEKTIE